MRKVGILSGSYLLNVWNGLGRHTNSLAKGLSSNMDVKVYAPSDKASTYVTQLGQTLLTRIALSNLKKVAALSVDCYNQWNTALYKQIENETFDYLILTTYDSWTAAKQYVDKYPNCQIIGFVNFLYSQARYVLTDEHRVRVMQTEKEFLEECTAIVSHSELLAELTAIKANRNVYLVPNTLVYGEKAFPLSKPKPKSICYVGRLNKSKQIETLVRVVAKLPDITLTIASPETTPNYLARLRSIIKGLKIEDRVCIAGWLNTDSVRQLYKSSSLAVVTGMYEPYAYTVLDPMLHGTPVIVSSFSGLQDYLINKDNQYANIDTLCQLIEDKTSKDLTSEREQGIIHTLRNYTSVNLAYSMEECLR